MSASSAESGGDAVPGACLCDAVRFEVRPPTRFCGHCHCTMCRRNHGAAFVTWFGVPRDQLRIVAGESLLTRYQSSEHGYRSFCSRCGTALFCELDRDPDTVDVPLAVMQGPIDRAPEAHVFWDTHVDWVQLADELPKLGMV